MPSTGVLITAAAALITLMLAVRLARTYFGMRGMRVVLCPDNRRTAGVELDAGRAALSGILHAPELRLRSCSRWPEKQDCGRECLRQVAEAGDACLLRDMVADWYEGKSCAMCGRRIGDIDWSVSKPGLITQQGAILGWAEVDFGRIHEILDTSNPVCFTCHVTNRFVRNHPELVVDRSSRRA